MSVTLIILALPPSLSLLVYALNPKVGCQSSRDKANGRREFRNGSPQCVNFFKDDPNPKCMELKVAQSEEGGGGFTIRYGVLSHKGYYPDESTKPNQVI